MRRQAGLDVGHAWRLILALVVWQGHDDGVPAGCRQQSPAKEWSMAELGSRVDFPGPDVYCWSLPRTRKG